MRDVQGIFNLGSSFQLHKWGRTRRQRRRGGGVWGGVSPPRRGREGAGEGAVAPPQNFFLILALNMASFVAFWMVFLTVQLPVLHAKPV